MKYGERRVFHEKKNITYKMHHIGIQSDNSSHKEGGSRNTTKITTVAITVTNILLLFTFVLFPVSFLSMFKWQFCYLTYNVLSISKGKTQFSNVYILLRHSWNWFLFIHDTTKIGKNIGKSGRNESYLPHRQIKKPGTLEMLYHDIWQIIAGIWRMFYWHE